MEFELLKDWTGFITTYRKEKKLSIHQMAIKTGMTSKTIVNWLNGKTSPTINTANKALSGLGYELFLHKKND